MDSMSEISFIFMQTAKDENEGKVQSSAAHFWDNGKIGFSAVLKAAS